MSLRKLKLNVGKRGATEIKNRKFFQSVTPRGKRGATESAFHLQSITPKNKRGATEWTVGKLLAIILAVLVLALVIYGISTGGFKPLFEKVEGAFNNVLIMLNLKEDSAGSSGECLKPKDASISGVGEGELVICKEYCSLLLEKPLSLGLSYGATLDSSRVFYYNYSNGFVYAGSQNVLNNVPSISSPRDAIAMEFFVALKESLFEELNTENVQDISEKLGKDPVEIRIYVFAQGLFDEDHTFLWRGGRWYFDGEETEWDNEQAVQRIYKESDETKDDLVYYKSKKYNSRLNGYKEYITDNGEFDDWDKESPLFFRFLSEKQEAGDSFVRKAKELNNLLGESSIEVGGKAYSPKFAFFNGRLLYFIQENSQNYGVAFSEDTLNCPDNYLVEGDPAEYALGKRCLRLFYYVGGEWKIYGGVGGDPYLYLGDSEFEKLKKQSELVNYLKSNC